MSDNANHHDLGNLMSVVTGDWNANGCLIVHHYHSKHLATSGGAEFEQAFTFLNVPDYKNWLTGVEHIKDIADTAARNDDNTMWRKFLEAVEVFEAKWTGEFVPIDIREAYEDTKTHLPSA